MSTLGPSVTLREVNSNGIRVLVAEAGSGLTAHLLSDCGHIIPLDRPDELLAILTPFLDEDLHI